MFIMNIREICDNDKILIVFKSKRILSLSLSLYLDLGQILTNSHHLVICTLKGFTLVLGNGQIRINNHKSEAANLRS